MKNSLSPNREEKASGDDKQNLQDLLPRYGTIIAEYAGEGTLRLNDKLETKCQFRAVQIANGLVLLMCNFTSKNDELISEFLKCTSFKHFAGNTLEGYETQAETSAQIVRRSIEEISGNCQLIFLPYKLYINIDKHKTANKIRFGLTNFEFFGTDEVEMIEDSGRAKSVSWSALQLDLKGEKVYIKQVDNYENEIGQIKASRDVGVTCEASVAIMVSKDIDTIKNNIGNLCDLISIARTKIQWIYYDLLENDVLISKVHELRMARKYNALPIISMMGSAGKEVKAFLETTYPIYAERRDPYRLHEGTIDAYLDAKGGSDLAEMRGAKLVVSMERLKALFLELQKSHTDECEHITEYIINEDDFEGLLPEIKKSLSSILKNNGFDKEVRGEIYSNLRCMNRISFMDLLKMLCKDINLTLSERELRLFIKSRNKLVHIGQFYCDVATAKERKSCAPLSDNYEEYRFLINVLDRVFLKLIGYNGPYINYLTGNKENI
ncbi:Uncharacterised protein [uncultured archaeon]|nr:Uncharacterised protein [uncultured archaeon]